MVHATVADDSRVQLPEEIKRKLGVGPGDEIVFDDTREEIVVRKGKRTLMERLDEFRGPIWHGYAEEVQRARDEWDR
jgi:bifunctional DNA-binding transcriptional regulator/antitoxin component of YhaV-PrlF toxin-antitoxin module